MSRERRPYFRPRLRLLTPADVERLEGKHGGPLSMVILHGKGGETAAASPGIRSVRRAAKQKSKA